MAFRFGSTTDPSKIVSEAVQEADEYGHHSGFLLTLNVLVSFLKGKVAKGDFVCFATKIPEPTMTRTNFSNAPLIRTIRSGPAASLTILSSAEK